MKDIDRSEEMEEQIRQAFEDIRQKGREAQELGVKLKVGDRITVVVDGKRQRKIFTIVNTSNIYICAVHALSGRMVEIFLEQPSIIDQIIGKEK